MLGFIFYLILLTILTYFEQSVEAGNIKNFGDSIWYSVVTLATVGYGDKFPVSWEGKIIGVIFVISSVGILGTLISKISSIIQEKIERTKMGLDGTNFENHIIIMGYDSFANHIIENLLEEKQKVCIITDNKENIDKLHENYPDKNKFFVMYSDYDDLERIKKANVEKAHVVFFNLPSDTDNLVCILNLKSKFENTSFLVTLNDTKLRVPFKNAGVTYIISKEEIASKLIASYIFESHAADFNLDILSSTDNNEDFDTMQFYVNEQNPFVNKTYGELFEKIRKATKALPVGIHHNNVTTKLAEDNVIIQKGDYLLFIGNLEAKEYLTATFGINQGHRK